MAIVSILGLTLLWGCDPSLSALEKRVAALEKNQSVMTDTDEHHTQSIVILTHMMRQLSQTQHIPHEYTVIDQPTHTGEVTR